MAHRCPGASVVYARVADEVRHEIRPGGKRFMQLTAAADMLHVPAAYIALNIDPILLQFGAIAIHWYALGYVVAISIGLFFLLRYTRRVGLHEDQVWGLFFWTALAGLIGGRLYFVVQQPDLVSDYLLKPINIIAVWNGGMAFFGAIFVGAATLFVLAPRYGVDRFLAIDGGALFAAIGQIFGRFGNIINGDITGYALSTGPITIPGDTCAHAPCIAYVSDPHYLPWSVVYLNAHSFAAQAIPYQPAPVYEMLMNVAILAILLPLRFRLPRLRAGLFFVLYLALYAVSQFLVFFARGSEPITPFLGITALKQAQWTAVFVLLACIPLALLVRRYGKPWPYSEENPVPYPVVATEPAKARVLAQPAPAVAATVGTSKPASPVPPAPARSAASSAPPAAEQAVELPPWQPVRPRGGALRNVFTSRPPAGTAGV
jgi:phosphatidylglycerol:prolipoprotein diacylglycerol transferase